MTDPFPSEYLSDIYTEPEVDPDTRSQLGPLTGLVGVWEGVFGTDVHPQVDGPEVDGYVERWTFDILDPQTNGPQVYFGLRYHQHVTKPDDTETFHDQVGYLLWEPATSTIVMTLAIPRGQIAMAGGTAPADARSFTLRSSVDDPHFTIASAPFLDAAFRTTAWEVAFVLDGDTLTYEQTTTLHPAGDSQPFAHTDTNRLTRVADVPANPLAGGPVLR